MNHKTFTKEQKEHWLQIGLNHQKHDRFIQGNWLTNEKVDGLFIGCYMQIEDNVLSTAAKEMNLPEWLARVSEIIFEGISVEESLTFPVDLIKAIPTDSNLEQLWKDWNYTILMDEKYGQYKYCKNNDECKNAVLKVAQLFKLDNITESAAWSAKANYYSWMKDTLIKMLENYGK